MKQIRKQMTRNQVICLKSQHELRTEPSWLVSTFSRENVHMGHDNRPVVWSQITTLIIRRPHAK